MERGDFTGAVEARNIGNELRQLAGGRVYKNAVPDGKELDRTGDGSVRPYLIMRFSPPIAAQVGRNVAGGEQDQPHLLTGTVIACADDDDSAESLMRDAMRAIIGKQFSTNSLPLKARGGNSWSTIDQNSRPSRYQYVFYWRAIINN